MDYKKKLKLRLSTAIIYIVLGVMMIVGALVTKSDNNFISAFGFALVIAGILRVRNYFMITKDEETIRKQQIAETDERSLFILHKAKSDAFSIYLLISAAAVIILSFFSIHEAAKWIAYSVCLLVLIYWICYWVYQKKS